MTPVEIYFLKKEKKHKRKRKKNVWEKQLKEEKGKKI